MFYEKFKRYATAVEMLTEIIEKDNEPFLKQTVDYLKNQKSLFGKMQIEQINNCPVVYQEVKPLNKYNHANIS